MTELIPLHYLYSFEIRGTYLANEVEIKRLGELVNWLKGLIEALSALNDFFSDTAKLIALHNPQKGEEIEMVSYNVISPFITFIAKVRGKINRDIATGRATPSMYISQYFGEESAKSIYDLANEMLKNNICAQCRLALLPTIHIKQKSCCWVDEFGGYTSPRILINDITAVYHRIFEFYVKFLEEFGEVHVLSDKSRYSITASDVAIKTLTMWDNAVHVNNKLGIYGLEDYSALTGFALDNLVELQVGSTSGHLTKIDLNNNRVDYFDNDVPVIDVMARLFYYIGGGLKSYEYNHAVYTFRPDKYREVALIISLATSMDFRVGDALEDIWGRLFLKTIDYEAYLITKNPMYLGEEYEGVRSIKDVRELDHENFVETIMSGYFVELPFSAVIKQALAYARRNPEAYEDLKAKVEKIWASADKAYWILRERGIIGEAVRAGIERGMYTVDNYITRYLRNNLPDYYQKIIDAILEFVARVHWYYLKALVESGFIPSI